ncbi:MAG: hypothetical protein IAE79_00190, partial [Anaerolinea sp.]|nr:hypothetical protein [Anaerolinea sp.]
LNYEGNGSPHTAILSGLTQIPSNMAIGATWNPGYAQTVGQVVGRDLTALGVNMLLGPSLDVLETPQPGSTADMGVRSFGGDPYWVGLMGQAYISGVHQGSNNRMAVIAKHFPGNGSSDRPVDDEVPTVRKSLEQLKQIELAPFFAVTNGRTNSAATVDGLLTTHIRYQGFQGNIRATTVPVSFDPQALKTLMSLDAFTGWRQSGGVIVSDSLGVRSVEKFYDDTEREFPHRRIAKDALLAGNDLLYLSEFALGKGDFAAELANIKDTIIWFREKYETDTSFAQRVDEAVLRILQLKLRLYGGDFSEENILQDTASLSRIIEPANATMLGLAQAAITLISPSQAELVERLASPPGLGDQIIIFTDERQVQQCSACAPISVIGKTALEQRILSLYGPGATAQVQPNQIRSFSFAELAAFLAAGPGGVFPVMTPTAVTPTAVTPTAPIPIDITETAEPTENALPTFTPTATATATPPPEYWVQEWLRDATWIIFAVQNKTEASLVLHQFLAQRTDLIRGRKVIVFAYDAPYYLDTTEISKLTAYFSLYNKSSAAIDTSVRALFQEIPLPGALPVSVPGIGYDLFRQTQPNAQQLIELFIISDSGLVQSPPGEAPLDASVGDTLHLQTGVIRDQNGNAVPDGTIVQFIQQDRIQGLVNIIANVSTSNGLAVFDYILEARTGQFRITAVSGDATRSQAVDIIIEDDAQVRIITPTPAPT